MDPRVRLFDLPIDVVNMQQAVDRIMAWRDDNYPGCRFVVTPNVDHTVLANNFPAFQRACEEAHLVLADGLPIIVVSRVLKKPLPERVAGSELVPQLFTAATHQRPLRVFLLGAAPGVADRAAIRIGQQWPAVTVVGTYSPPFGFEEDPQEEQRILDRLHQAKPELIVVGLAAPQQEIWVHRLHPELPARVVLCGGATIDFIAGEKKQAPVWMRRTGLEWFFRVMTEPRRLAGRVCSRCLGLSATRLSRMAFRLNAFSTKPGSPACLHHFFISEPFFRVESGANPQVGSNCEMRWG